MHDSLAGIAHVPLPKNKKEKFARLKQEVLAMYDSGAGGAVKIHQALERRYGKKVCGQRFVSERIAERAAISEPLESPEPWNRWEPYLWQQDAGYLLRLDLICRTLLDRGLSEEEARIATRLEISFGGLGEIARWALVDAYARRRRNTTAPETSDLDLLISTKPWSDDGEFYRAARNAGHGWWAHIDLLELGSSPSATEMFLGLHIAVELRVPLFVSNGDTTTVYMPRTAQFVMKESGDSTDRVTASKERAQKLVSSINDLIGESEEQITVIAPQGQPASESPISDDESSPKSEPSTADDWKSVLISVWNHRDTVEFESEEDVHAEQ